MIITPDYSCVFIKTMKTAGSSIEVFLARHCGPGAIITPMFPLEPGHVAKNDAGFFDHCTAANVRDWMGEERWCNFFSFCVERDPWEKVLSLYSMHKSGGRKNTESLDAFLEGNDFPINYPIYTERNDPNKVIVNRVLRYEHLAKELAEVFDQLGIPFSGSLGSNAKGGFRTDRRPAREVLTPAQYNRIGDLFAHEIRMHGWY